LFVDGRAQADNEEGLSVTAELAENQAVDTALALVDSGNLSLGVIHLVSNDRSNVLIARGLDGVYEIGWNDVPPDNLTDFIEELDTLLEGMLENAEDITPTPDPDATPGTVTPTPDGEETPEATPEQ
jgi:hypothetical protein